MFPPGHLRRLHPNHAGHPEVHQKPAPVIQFHHDITRAPAHIDDPAPLQSGRKQRRQRFAHGRSKHLHLYDPAFHQRALQSPSDILSLR